MKEIYDVDWKKLNLPTGQQFFAAVCGYNNKVRHMAFYDDYLRQALVKHTIIEDGICHGREHCLAIDCPLNETEEEHLLHMLDMKEDIPADSELAKQWETDSMLECYIKFAHKLSAEIQAEEKKTES
jgi:hypothetical protein